MVTEAGGLARASPNHGNGWLRLLTAVDQAPIGGGQESKQACEQKMTDFKG